MADEYGFKAARKYIAMIKYAAPKAALRLSMKQSRFTVHTVYLKTAACQHCIQTYAPYG